ncbi:MAG: ABC transporter permease [Candidatus Sumerlaeota bacterium]|nr:ABC transporter permease [Candidatus Sumerlaeota bacterium]
MLPYILRRLTMMLVVLWAVVTATFLLMHAIPGGPFDRERVVPAAVKDAVARRYRLDDPLWRQYADYLAHLARFDLGPSYTYQGRTVNDIIADGFPTSALLGFLSIVLSLAAGVPLGMISAARRNGWIDNASMLAAIGLVSVPSFVLASMLIYLFAYGPVPALHCLPASWRSALPGESLGLPERLRTLAIPVFSLAGFSLAYITRLTRAGFIEVLGQDYIRTARAKGLGTMRVFLKHGLRNAISPVATYLGPLVAGVFTGSFVIERIYAIPGLGKFYVTSIANRDYPLILGLTIFYCAFLVAMNLLVDIGYVFLDPRVSLRGK